ncbi:MAG: hypothetical protein IJS82_01870 [Paludibacteraceae bacterium]|nr:hypothetical protein [Paludibacteraceae bacterium]
MKRTILFLFTLALTLSVSAQAMSVAEVLAAVSELETGVTTDETYTFTGYVTHITENSFATSYNNMSFWVSDANNSASSNAEGAVLAYRIKPDVELAEGNRVEVTARIKNWNGTLEAVNGTATYLGDAEPEVRGKGAMRICAQNLENYYYNYNTGRGNYTEEERAAKTRKIVNMMLSVDADVYAFCEVEAQPIVLEQLADSANAQVEGNPYQAVYDGIDEDWDETYNNNIKSGFIYRSDRVATVGSNIGGTSGNGYYSHTMRIQAFKLLSNNEKLVVSMNHFKAKNSSSSSDNDPTESMRITNANNLINTLNNRVTTDPDILILGDLNCEYEETPVQMIVNEGFEEQLLRFNSGAYSHCYGGGELIDHVLANETMREQVTNAYVKHICTYKCTTGVTSAMSYSDHDPYIVELNLCSTGDCDEETGVESIQPSVFSIQKVLRDGQLYFLMADGTQYNILGIKIK